MNITKDIFRQLKEYQNGISEQLIIANQEKKELIEKVNSGEPLTKKESKRNKNLTSKIKLLQEIFTSVDKLIQTKEFETNFKILNSDATEEAKNYAENILVGIIKNISTSNIVGVENLAKMPENLDENLDDIKEKIEYDLKTLNEDLAYAKRRNKEESEIIAIETDIEERQNDLAKINKYLSKIPSDKDIRKDLNDYEVATKNTKSKIKKKYIKLLNDYQERIIERIEKNKAQINALDKSKLNLLKEKFISNLKGFNIVKPIDNEEELSEDDETIVTKNNENNAKKEEKVVDNKQNSDKNDKNNQENSNKTAKKSENNETSKKNSSNKQSILILGEKDHTRMKTEGKILIADNNRNDNDEDIYFGYERYDNFNDFFKKHWQKIVGITAAAIGVVSIIIVGKQFIKDLKKDNSKDNLDTPTSSIETEISNSYDEKVLALMEKGYGEYEAGLMFENFDENLINRLLSMPYIEKVTNYVTTQDFNLDYLEDYENVRTVNNITSKQAVDYVNRSYKIQEANFYPEASIDDIAKIVMAFSNGMLYNEDFSYVLNPIDSTINEITNNYRFGTVKEEDIKKIEALQYFAKEGTDLSNFLRRYSTLAADVLRNPFDGAKKDKLYSFLTIYATSLNNGFINELDVRTDDEEFNNDAILNSNYDFQVAYDGFVQSTIPLLIPSINEPGAYQNYIDTTGRTQKSIELQELLLTAVNNNTINCEKGRTLGGE